MFFTAKISTTHRGLLVIARFDELSTVLPYAVWLALILALFLKETITQYANNTHAHHRVRAFRVCFLSCFSPCFLLCFPYSCAPVLRCAIAPPCVAPLPVPSCACACLLRIFTLPLLLFLCLRSAAILVLSFAALHCASTVLPAPHMHSTCALRACFACVLSVLAPSFFVSTVGARFSVSSFPCFQSSHGFSYNSYIIILKL